MVKIADIATGLFKRTNTAQASSSNRYVCLQVDKKYMLTLPFNGVTGSDVWVTSAIDYITRNDYCKGAFSSTYFPKNCRKQKETTVKRTIISTDDGSTYLDAYICV